MDVAAIIVGLLTALLTIWRKSEADSARAQLLRAQANAAAVIEEMRARAREREKEIDDETNKRKVGSDPDSAADGFDRFGVR